MRKLSFVIVGVLMWLSGGMLAAQNLSDCEQFIASYVEKNALVKKPVGDKSYNILFEISTFSRKQPEQEVKQGVTELILSAGGFIYENESVSLYQDSKNSFLVIHPAKTIVWRSAEKTKEQSSEILNYSGFQKDFLKRGKIGLCKDVTIGGKQLRKSVFEVDSAYKQVYTTDKIEFYYDVNTQTVKRQIVYHTKEKPYVRTKILYLKTDLQSNKTVGEARSYILSKDGKLLEKYKEYEFLDKRAN